MADMVKFKRGTLAKLGNVGKVAGQILVCTDERAMYLDLSSTERIRIGDFQEYANWAAIQAIPTTNLSTTALYYATAENILAKYTGSGWNQINAQNDLAALGGVSQSVYDAKIKDLEDADQANADNISGVDERLKAAEEILKDVATGSGVAELTERVTAVEGKVATIEGDYLKSSDKTALEGKIAEAQSAGDNAQLYAEGVAKDLGDHEKDGVAHITAAERTLWTGKTDLDTVKGLGYATKEEAQGYANAKDEAIQAAKDRADEAYNLANGKADMDDVNTAIANAGHAVKSEVDTAIENLGKAYIAADEVLQGNIDKKVDQTAYNTKMDELDAEDERLAGLISGISEDYLKSADKTELQGKIDGVSGRVATIEGDYLKKADKEALEGQIALKAAQTALDAEVEAREGAIEGLQNQINLIMNNPDTEKVVNSITEFTAWVEEHGTLAEGMREDIDKNKDDIAAEVKRAGEAESALAGRLDTLEGKFIGEGSVASLIATAKQEAIDAAAEAADDKDEVILAAAKKYADDEDAKIESRVGALETASATHATKDELKAVSDDLAEYEEAHKNDYDNDAVDAKVKAVQDQIDVLGNTYATDKELTDAIAAEVERANGAYAGKSYEAKVDTHVVDKVVHITADERTAWNGAVSDLADHKSAYDTKVAALEAEDADIRADFAAADTGLKTELKGYADQVLADAKADASNKDAVVLSEAQKYADQAEADAISAAEGKVNALAGNVYTKAQTYTQSEVDAAIETALTWGSF